MDTVTAEANINTMQLCFYWRSNPGDSLWPHVKVEIQYSVFTQSFAAALVRSELVALDAPALEPPLCVGTALAAVAFFSTLVHIWNGPQRGGTERCWGVNNSRHKAECTEVAGRWKTNLRNTSTSFLLHPLNFKFNSWPCQHTCRIWKQSRRFYCVSTVSGPHQILINNFSGPSYTFHEVT